jgi:glycosyltransferase involved in cell wall biosynthesis
LSVVVCTRDRSSDLERCVDSVLRSAAGVALVELVIVDDGAPGGTPVDSLRGRATGAGVLFAYLKNLEPQGLFHSRIAGLEHSHGAVVLFLDDDVTVAEDYLARLTALYRDHPAAAGIGGVDQLDTPRPLIVRLLHRLFLFDSGHPGRLSASGFPGSMRRWIAEREDFSSEYLHGSNMSFRRPAIAALPRVGWLSGYSLAEDLYVSRFAGAAGRLIVSPGLRVWHHRSPMSRDDETAVGQAQVVNVLHLLRLEHASSPRILAFFWTVAWFVLKDVTRPGRIRRVRGYVRGIVDVALKRRPPATAPTP